MQTAARVTHLPPYLFLSLDQMVQRERARGRDIINLGIGDPDMPSAPDAVIALQQTVNDPETHRYPEALGSKRFRKAITDRYHARFGVDLDPETQVISLIGSKEGIAHLTWAYAEPGDLVLVPDPAYPVYRAQAEFTGATVYPLPLLPENHFLPNLGTLDPSILVRSKLLWLNYPNNPTGAVAPRAFYEEAVSLCRQYDILLCSDLAYADIGFGGYRPESVLSIPGADEVAIELYSLSKSFNMTGWRIAAAVGMRSAVLALGQVKSYLDSGPFTAIQNAAVAVLDTEPDAFIRGLNTIYEKRLNLALREIRAMGLLGEVPRSTFYVWFRTPPGMSSAAAASFFVQAAGVALTPGSAYGVYGEGWLRLSLTVPFVTLEDALMRMRQALSHRDNR